MNDSKRKVIVISSCMAVKNVLGDVTRPQVQQLRDMPKLNYASAIQFLTGNSLDQSVLVESAKAFAKKLRTYDNAAFKRRLPTLNDMYAVIPKDAAFKSKVHEPATRMPVQVPIKVHLVTLNALLRQRNLKPLAVWSGTHAAILERIAKVKAAMEQDRSEAKRVPTVVAEGAYKSDEEAFARTGHRVGGRTKNDDKNDARKKRFIDSRVETTSTHNIKLGNIKINKASKKITVKGDTVKLGEIAAALNIEAKVARHKARRYAVELKKLEIAKYTYPAAKAEAVKAILNADNRKRK